MHMVNNKMSLNYIYNGDIENSRVSGNGIFSGTRLNSVYQPILDHQNYLLVGFEALSRPVVDGRPMNPLTWFHQMATEKNAWVADLWAIRLAFESFLGSPINSISLLLFVNMIPTSVMSAQFLPTIERLFQFTGISPQNVVFELVEYTNTWLPGLQERLQLLRDLGAKIAMDDVGVGTGDLQALVLFEPDYMKLDRSLVDGVSQSTAKQRMLRALARYGDESHHWVAEGIEQYDDLVVTRELGFRLSQGFYWGQPLPSQKLSSLQMDGELYRTRMEDMTHRKTDISPYPPLLIK